MKKAFDLVQHHILIQKFEIYGVIGNALLFFQSYLSDHSQFVVFNSVASEKFLSL